MRCKQNQIKLLRQPSKTMIRKVLTLRMKRILMILLESMVVMNEIVSKIVGRHPKDYYFLFVQKRGSASSFFDPLVKANVGKHASGPLCLNQNFLVKNTTPWLL
mmetsp:Transcript_44777/g.52488  ORF Transcript_44777/g.52488 Transcript_44777/m.52488 type:complete len:104 (+) Transcript_44777:924-1235(+)